MFLHNLNSIEPNLDITNDIIINGSKELQKEFDYNDIALENSIFSDKLLVEIAIQQSNKSEMDRIIFALGLDNKLKKYTSEQKEKRHTIKDIHKHGTLARVYEKSSKLNLSTDNNQRKIVAKVLAVNLGVRLFNSAYILYMVKHGLASPEMMFAVSGFSILLCNLAIFKSWSNLRDILLKRSRHDFMIKKYSYKEELESNDEDRNNGSNNHRGR